MGRRARGLNPYFPAPMSFENTQCPCGGTKERETLICRDCLTQFTGSMELAIYQQHDGRTESRRAAAIRLLAMARKRQRKLALAFS